MSASRNLRGLVLAGGRSSRMGADKATLTHPDGRSLVRRCCDLLLEAGCRGVAISLRDDQAVPPGMADVAVVRDEGESKGPMAGMVAGMRLDPEADWLVVACDLPRLDLATLGHLIGERRTHEDFLAYRSEFDGLPEPLCTYYAAASLSVLEKARAEDFRCPRKILIRAGCRLLEPVTPRALDNANTPEDWNTAIQP